MALDDFRRWIDVGARAGMAGAVMLEAPARNATAADFTGCLLLTVTQDGGGVAEVELDWSDAGLLVDALREGMAVLLARMGDPVAAAAIAGRQLAGDTPPADRS
jgi:hypothetical protein